MRLALSNIAWDIAEDEDVARLLTRHAIDAIDVAPGKYFSDPVNASDLDVSRLKAWWLARGIEITGMQSLLFGTQGLNLFAASDVQEAMLARLAAVCRIGAGLGARYLVFGSPRNRDRTGLDDEQTLTMAQIFFRRLGDVAQAQGVCICLEPNPPCYGANFMTNSTQTAQVVAAVAHPAIKMQLDTGALHLNGENAEDILRHHRHLIGHIHASEPDLVPLGDGGVSHALIHDALLQFLPEHLVTIEMLATKQEAPLKAIERALQKAVDCYQPTKRVAP